jgi:hypothetical protein
VTRPELDPKLRLQVLTLAVAAACGSPPVAAPPSTAPTPAPAAEASAGLVGHTASGASVRLVVAGDKIASVTPGEGAQWLWLPIVDSHVHLAYWSVADQLVTAGVEAVVDLAAPEPGFDKLGQASGLHVLAAGPMLTRDKGYPLASWGSDGYGIGCSDATCVVTTIDRLASHGAQVIKLALDDQGLAPALVPVAVTAAHDRKLKVAVHALSDASAAVAGRAGADILAHTPVQPLADATIALWRGRAVISTLAAFGGSDAAVANLRKLRAAGATVLYGTDLGNARVAGPNGEEVALLRKAGLDDAAIAEAMTTVPAAYWGLPFGLAPGSEATLLVLDGDPRRDLTALFAPREVWLRGHRVPPRGL